MKIYNRLIFIVLIFFFVFTSQGFSLGKRARILIYNINFGGLVGGIGALINHKSGQKWYEAMFFGFCKGAAGGAVMYEGKNLTTLIKSRKKLEYGWFSRIVHTTGVSMVENAASGRGLFETWNMHFGPVRFEARPFELTGKVKFLPYATGTFLKASCMGSWSPWKTIRSGAPFFSFNHESGGATLGNEILIDESARNWHQCAAHEYIHVLQHREFNSLNCFFLPADTLLRKNKIFSTVSEYVFFDVPFFYPAYRFEGIRDTNDKAYHHNYFEMEADYFSEQ